MSFGESSRDAYRVEASELLDELQDVLLALEQTPDDMKRVGEAFRLLHTVKGSGAMFGFDDIAEFTHDLESAFDQVRSGRLAIGKELIDLALAARDHLVQLLDHEGPLSSQLAATGDALSEQLHSLASNTMRREAAAPPAPDATTYRVRFVPPPMMIRNGARLAPLLEELQEMGRVELTAFTDRVPPLEELDPECLHLYWDAVITTAAEPSEIRGVFIFVEDDAELTISEIDSPDREWVDRRLGEILVDRGDTDTSEIETVLRQRPLLGDVFTEAGLVTKEQVQSALIEQQCLREKQEVRATAKDSLSVRVSADKLDTLVDLVGELVVAEARLNEATSTREDPELAAISEDIERLIGELRDGALHLRMLTMGGTFSRLRRLVRDLSSELGKAIRFVTEGADTELDKTVIERLADPLVHLLRNSIDHGIESAEERAAAGKPAEGTIRISANHVAGKVVIEISDDGAGFDSEAIRSKAIEQGLLNPDDRPSDKELFQLVFAPGFSTAKQLSGVSGRGVGMDVVKSAITSLRGTVEIRSQKGQNSCVTIELPLTLAIIEGLLVRVAEEKMVLPLGLVEECVDLSREASDGNANRQLAEVRGELVPIIRLRDWFGLGEGRPEIEQLVVTNLDGGHFGLVVDEVIGQHQTVIKSLGPLNQDVEEFSGATILGNGEVALILDPAKLAAGLHRSDGP